MKMLVMTHGHCRRIDNRDIKTNPDIINLGNDAAESFEFARDIHREAKSQSREQVLFSRRRMTQGAVRGSAFPCADIPSVLDYWRRPWLRGQIDMDERSIGYCVGSF